MAAGRGKAGEGDGMVPVGPDVDQTLLFFLLSYLFTKLQFRNSASSFHVAI